MLRLAESHKRSYLAEVDEVAFIPTDTDASRRHAHANGTASFKIRHHDVPLLQQSFIVEPTDALVKGHGEQTLFQLAFLAGCAGAGLGEWEPAYTPALLRAGPRPDPPAAATFSRGPEGAASNEKCCFRADQRVSDPRGTVTWTVM
jgi:hypothetical protein